MKNNNTIVAQTTLEGLITSLGINKSHIAERMSMPQGTFKNKLNDKLPQYRFSEPEFEKLRGILIDMANKLRDFFPVLI